MALTPEQIKELELRKRKLELEMALAEEDQVDGAPPLAPTVTPEAAALKTFQQEGTFGFSDEAVGGIDAAITGGNRALNAVGLGTTDPYAGQDLKQVYQQGRDEERQAIKTAQEQQPAAAAVGSVLGPLFTAPLGGPMAQGALSGLGHSEADLTEGDLKGAAVDTALGGAAGYVGDKAASGAGFLKDYLVSKLKSGAVNRASAALGFSKGLRKGKEAAVRDASEKALENGVVSPLASTEDMLSRTKDVASSAGQKFQDVAAEVGSLGMKVDQSALTMGIARELAPQYYRPNIEPGISRKFVGILKEVSQKVDNPAAIKELKDSLRMHGWNPSNGRPYETVDGAMYRDVWGSLDSKYNEAVEMAAGVIKDPKVAQDLAQAKGDWRFAKTVTPALEDKLAKDGNKMFGLTDTIAAAGALGYGGTTGDWTTSAGIMALKKGGEKWGNQLASTGMYNLSKVLSKNLPQQFSAALHNAMARGGEAAASSTHYLLMQSYPEYRKAMMDEAMDDTENNPQGESND